MRTSPTPATTGMLVRSSVPAGTGCWRTIEPFTQTSSVDGVAAKAVKDGRGATTRYGSSAKSRPQVTPPTTPEDPIPWDATTASPTTSFSSRERSS